MSTMCYACAQLHHLDSMRDMIRRVNHRKGKYEVSGLNFPPIKYEEE